MAATSVLKLVIDDKEYEASLKNAKTGMMDLQNALKAAGKTFMDCDKQVVEYARAIGQMDTVSKTARGRIGEMSQAFIELKSQYINMTDAEKQSPVGQAMSKSLEELKGRTIEAKQQLEELNKELEVNSGDAKESSSVLGQLAGKFTVNIDALNLFNIGLQAAEGALNVAKDAFFASEVNVDEWGRTMQAAQSLYDGFLTSLNNGDFSGFLSRIDEIVQAARTAYDELDRLGTMKTIQAPAMSRQETENQRMRTMLMTGRWISAADGRRSNNGLKDGDLLSPSQLKVIERQLQNGMQTIVGFTRNEVKQTGKAIDAYYNSLAKQNGMTLAEFRKGTSSMAEFDKMQEGYRNYQKWRKENSFTDAWGNTRYREGNPYQEFKKWGTFRVDKMGENSYNELVGLIRQQQQQQNQMYAQIGQAYRTINRAEGVTVKNIMNGGKVGSGKQKDDPEQKFREKQLEEWVDAERKAAFEVGKIRDKERSDAEKRAKELQPNTVGTNIQTNSGLTAYISDLKKQIDNAQIGSYMYQSLSEQLADTTMLQNLVSESLKAGLGTAMFDVADEFGEDFWTRAMEGGVENADWQAIADKISEKLKEMGLEGLNLNFDTGEVSGGDKKEKDDSASGQAQKLVSGLSSVASGLQQMGVKLPEGVSKILGVVQGAMTVISGIGTIISVVDIPSKTANTISVNANTTALVANTLTMGALEAAMWAVAATNAIPFARGGIVPHAAGGHYVGGGRYSGDTTPVLANAGELILNASEQGNLASILEGNNLQNLRLSATIKGEDIRLSLNNNGRRTGRGEYITTNFR